MRNRRITKPYFRNCSTCRSRSKAPLCLCTRSVITDHAEGTFGRLRYLLGGDRPSQTAHIALFLARIHGTRLEPLQPKGGISRLAPWGLASPLQSLPPILHMTCEDPIPCYSKGARGLSVQSRVSGIFTATAISPSPLLRQRPSRYTIRAGRNFTLFHGFSWRRLYLHLVTSELRFSLPEYFRLLRRTHHHRNKYQGRRIMESALESIQGSHTLSRYGDHLTEILPSVLPATSCNVGRASPI